MGWSYGINDRGREVGYGVKAICDEPGCTEVIDRGLAYVCGHMHDGGEFGCGDYFCGEHLFYGDHREKDLTGGMCSRCWANYEAWSERGYPDDFQAREPAGIDGTPNA